MSGRYGFLAVKPLGEVRSHKVSMGALIDQSFLARTGGFYGHDWSTQLSRGLIDETVKLGFRSFVLFPSRETWILLARKAFISNKLIPFIFFTILVIIVAIVLIIIAPVRVITVRLVHVATDAICIRWTDHLSLEGLKLLLCLDDLLLDLKLFPFLWCINWRVARCVILVLNIVAKVSHIWEVLWLRWSEAGHHFVTTHSVDQVGCHWRTIDGDSLIRFQAGRMRVKFPLLLVFNWVIPWSLDKVYIRISVDPQLKLRVLG